MESEGRRKSGARWTALLPAFLLLLYAAWCGNLAGASAPWVSALGVLGLAGLLLGTAPLRSGSWARDPWLATSLAVLGALVLLRFGLPGGLLARIVEVVVLLAVVVALPRAVAQVWRDEEGRRWGVAGFALVLLGVSVWGLVFALLEGTRPALPLGHHNLLAAWLVVVAPLAALGLREPGLRRWLSAASLGVGIAALIATRSFGGGLALAAQLGLALFFVRDRRLRLALGGLAGLAVAVQGPRLLALLAGSDSSLAARQVYWQAGWEGFLARPWFGWGPGSVPRTLGEFLEPRPGINPPSEVVGQLHSLPLQLLYELGALGLFAALAVAGRIGWHLWQGRNGWHPFLGGLALVGGLVSSLSEAWWEALALPVAMGVAAGVALAGREEGQPGRVPSGRRRTGWRFLVWAGALTVLVAVGRETLGRLHYERARHAATPEEICRELSAALRSDGDNPLYLARRGPCGEGDPALARRAALLAPGVGVFQTSAGLQAARQNLPFEELLRRGMAADPLGAAAPYYLMVLRPETPEAAACGARALLSEPRLLAATFFEEHPELIAPIRKEILRWPGIDAGFRQALAEALSPPLVADGPGGTFGLGFDDPQGGLSLYAFHRRPWPWEWFAVLVRVERFESLQLPSAAELATSSPEAFPKATCRPSQPP